MTTENCQVSFVVCLFIWKFFVFFFCRRRSRCCCWWWAGYKHMNLKVLVFGRARSKSSMQTDIDLSSSVGWCWLTKLNASLKRLGPQMRRRYFFLFFSKFILSLYLICVINLTSFYINKSYHTLISPNIFLFFFISNFSIFFHSLLWTEPQWCQSVFCKF